MELTTSLDLAAIEVMDLLPVLIAFVLGFGARLIGLPPLVGFLAAGFLLGGLGFQSSVGLQEIADLGVTLLLFTIGLKLKIVFPIAVERTFAEVLLELDLLFDVLPLFGPSPVSNEGNG